MEYLMFENFGFLEMQEVVEEEELEWISNKDTFPMVESLVDFMPSNATSNYNALSIDNINSRSNTHQSPISVLENNSGGFNVNNGSSCSDSFPEVVEEEELEWISNKDTFPMVESLVDFMPSIATSNYNALSIDNINSSSNNHQSPISVLENSSGGFNVNNGSRNTMMIDLSCNFKVPGKARTKHGRRRRRDMVGPQFQCWSVVKKPKTSSIIGRKCLHCGSEKTPQWRAGPLGPKTLCNACGVRYKSGRLCDEYRPANSPTFSNELHSNSHRKVVELRRLKNEKMMMGTTVFAIKPADIG